MELDVFRTVRKSNILNELRNSNASLVEYRLFCVYLAHLPMSGDDNVVKFTLADYARIANLDRPRYVDLKAQAENMVGMTATLGNDDGGFSVYSIFAEFKLFKEDDAWMVSLECNPKIAPLIREHRTRFLRYKLYNTIYLKSYNQQRIYELLKQYEKIGSRTIDLMDLREHLSVGADEYPVWGDFSQKVLKVAQKALKESTDIYFEYNPVKKGRKVVAVKFEIFKNQEFIDRLKIDKFLPNTEGDDTTYEDANEIVVRSKDNNEDPDQFSFGEDMASDEEVERILAERDARAAVCAGCDSSEFDEFTPEQIKTLRDLAWNHISDEEVERHKAYCVNLLEARQYAAADYIAKKINLCNSYHEPVKKRFAFIKAAVDEDWR